MKKKLLVFGPSGLVGSSIVQVLENDFFIIAPTHKQVDITDLIQIKEIIQTSSPDLIINTAGFASMEEAEKNPQDAQVLNAKPSEYITKCLRSKDIPYYYISTDAVFYGSKKTSPIAEFRPLDPKGVYAVTKAEGERITLNASKKNGVIRITLPYALHFQKKSDIVRDTIARLRRGDTYYGIVDQMINPLFVDDVATGIGAILKQQSAGVYHVAASDFMSNYEFIRLIAGAFKLDPSLILKQKLSEFQKLKKAFRSQYCVLGIERFQNDFYRLPTIEESLQKFYRQGIK